MLGSKFVNNFFTCLCILWKAPGRANSPWVIHSMFWLDMSSTYSYSSSSLEFHGSTSELIGSSPPPPHLMPSHLPFVLEPRPNMTWVSSFPCENTRGSSPFLTASTRPSRVARTASSTNKTTTPVGVEYGLFDAYGISCIPRISLTTLEDWWVMGWTERRCWY